MPDSHFRWSLKAWHGPSGSSVLVQFTSSHSTDRFVALSDVMPQNEVVQFIDAVESGKVKTISIRFVSYRSVDQEGMCHGRSVDAGFGEGTITFQGETIDVQLDPYSIAVMTVSALHAAYADDFLAIRMLCQIAPYSSRKGGHYLLSRWSEAEQLIEKNAVDIAQSESRPLEHFDKTVILNRLSINPASRIWFKELLEWVECSDETLIKYLKESEVAEPNATMRDWWCYSSDIISTFVPYLYNKKRCHKNFLAFLGDLEEAGLVPPPTTQ